MLVYFAVNVYFCHHLSISTQEMLGGRKLFCFLHISRLQTNHLIYTRLLLFILEKCK